MMSNNKPTNGKPIKTVKDPLMILNTVREPEDQLLHQTNPFKERERVEISTSVSIINDSTTSSDDPQLNQLSSLLYDRTNITGAPSRLSI